MSLENLFSVEPTLPNLQKLKLPENPDKWSESLTTMVREFFPDISKNPLTIEFRKRDDQSGTAIGTVHVVSMEANKSALIPFIIEKFQLHPLDVWMEKGTQAVHPITKDTFKELFFVPSMADGMDKRPTDATGQYFNDPSMWTTNYPPLQGRYSYASAGYLIMDQISDTLTEEDLNSFKNALKEQPTLLQKFAKHGHTDLIKKLAAKKGVTPMSNAFEASAAQLIPTSILDIRREGFDKYSIISASEQAFDLASTVYMNHHDCQQFLAKITGKAQDIMNEVDLNGEKMEILRPAPTEGVWLYDKVEKGVVNADKFMSYTVKNKHGLIFNAMLIPQVVDYTGKKVSGKVLLSKTHSCYQNSIAGIEDPDSNFVQKIMRPCGLRVGQTGCFVYTHDGKAIATLPATIKAIEGHDHEYPEAIIIVDINGRQMRIKQRYGDSFETIKHVEKGSDKAMEAQPMEAQPMGSTHHIERVTVRLESLGFAEIKKDHFVIPTKMVWIAMEPMTEVVSSPNEWVEKTASVNMTLDPVTMKYTGIDYEFSGNGLPKLAYDERQAKILLANIGVPLDKIAGLMKEAKAIGKAKVHGAQKMRSKKDATKNVAALIVKIANLAKSMNANMIKQAAEVEDKATVDVLLSLNFLNSDNMGKFVSYVPVFERAADCLAEITLATRLGLKDVNTAASVGAMIKILEVVDGLKRIESSMKKPTTKTAAAVKPEDKKKKGKFGLAKRIAVIGG